MATAEKDKIKPGETQEEPSGTQALLLDFDIEGATLKPIHKEFLEKLLRIIKAEPKTEFVIAIAASADTLGHGVFDNQALSGRRASAVENFLRAQLPADAKVKFDRNAFGDDSAMAKDGAGVDDKFFRAVDVGLTQPKAPRLNRTVPRRAGGRPIPRPEFALTCVREFEMPRSTDFSIKVDSATFAGVGVKFARFILFIRDNTNRLQAQYNFNGIDTVTAGASASSIASSDNTPFKSFRTGFPTRVTEFQSAVIKSGLGVSILTPSAPPVISLTFKSEDGKTHPADSDIDFGSVANTARRISGDLSMESTCGRADLGNRVRGASKLDL